MEGVQKDVILPDYLNDITKWMVVVIETDTKEKFDTFMRKLLYDDNVTLSQFHDILKKLAYDINEYHQSEEIISSMSHIDKCMKYVLDYLEIQRKYDTRD